MAPAQMALPVDRRNGGPATPRRPIPTATPVPPVTPAPPLTSAGPVLPVSGPPAGPVSMSEVPLWVRRLTTGGVLVVAAVAAIGSYMHMVKLGLHVGEGWRAWLLPFSVVGLGLVE